MILQNPWALLLIPLCAFLLFRAERRRSEAALRFSDSGLFGGLKQGFRVKLLRGLIWLRLLCLTLIVLAIARPQAVTGESTPSGEGIDIVLAIDVSTSMLAEDFALGGAARSRIEAAKGIIGEFIRARENDRIAMVAFAAQPHLLSPLTLDRAWLARQLDRIEVGLIEDGTAIGAGLLSALNRLKDRRTSGSVIILLTDGRNNAGDVPPLAAAKAAKALDVKVYTVGIGSRGRALYPVADPFGRKVYRPADADLDEETLQAVARETGAAFFRASDADALGGVYRAIDQLERRPVEEQRHERHRDLYPWFLVPAMAILLAVFAARQTFLRSIP
jgi:Ca-activated chloride channel family protein